MIQKIVQQTFYFVCAGVIMLLCAGWNPLLYIG